MHPLIVFIVLIQATLFVYPLPGQSDCTFLSFWSTKEGVVVVVAAAAVAVVVVAVVVVVMKVRVLLESGLM